jgi:hypothetical protein
MPWHTFKYKVQLDVNFNTAPTEEDKQSAHEVARLRFMGLLSSLWEGWTPVGPKGNAILLKGYSAVLGESLTPADLEAQAVLAKELDEEVQLEARKLQLVNTVLGLDVTDSLEHFEEVLRGALSEKFQ